MALFGIPYYLMTNILPAVLLAIGVAYGLHLVGEFYERVAMHPEEDKAERVVRTMLRMWRPVLFTALTDVAAFLDLAVTSSMPPIKRFGMLSSLGVSVTYAFTIMAIPAALMLLPTRPSRVFRPAPVGGHHYASDLWHLSIDALKRFVVAYPWHIALVSGALALAAAWAATGLRVDDARVSSFSPSEPIYAAEHAINRATAGTVEMDIVVETDAPEDLYHPDYLRRIEALQHYAETLPMVGGTQSMVDFLKELHRALAGGDTAAATIPDSEEMIAQAFLLASMGTLSDVLTQYADTDYRRANIRVFVKSGYHSDIKVVHEALEHYVRTEFNAPGMEARLSGRMDMFYTWMESVASDHFVGVFVGLAMVWLVVSLSFRYFWIGLYTVIPVSATLVGIYAAMAISGITLGVGTAAFAAVAIGLTVDFAIHVLDHMVVLARDEGRPLPEAVTLMYPSTGRPVLFSFLCVFLGMCVLTQSALPPIYLFAVLLAVSLVVSFLASLVLLPALLLVVKPSFLKPRPE
jgi:predicted RND superfamily exporter protein